MSLACPHLQMEMAVTSEAETTLAQIEHTPEDLINSCVDSHKWHSQLRLELHPLVTKSLSLCYKKDEQKHRPCPGKYTLLGNHVHC